MIRRLIILLLIVGCEEVLESIKEGCTTTTACNYDSTATKDDGSCTYAEENYDCDGNCIAIIDNCGTCDSDSSNDCVQDCTGDWGGTAMLDECGVCGGNNESGTGICDCMSIPNGIAKDFGCAICIDYNTNNFSKVNEYTAESLLPNVCNYKNTFSETFITPAPDMDSSYIFVDSDDNTNLILISAPHAQRTYRYVEENDVVDSDSTRKRDLYTGAYAQILNDLTGMPTIIARYKSDDPNYYDYIPSETAVYEDHIGQMIPYKKKIKEFIEDESNNIMMVIDLHGAQNDHFERVWAIDIGIGFSESLNSSIGECVPDIVTHIFNKYNIEITFDEVFAAWTNETVTRFVAQDINKDLDAMQFEMKRDYRGGCSSDSNYYPDNYFDMIMAYTELIFTMNYIYNSEIENN